MTDVASAVVVTGHADRCMASGACVRLCSEVFASAEDGTVIVVLERPSADLLDRVLAAADACPSGAIDVDRGQPR